MSGHNIPVLANAQTPLILNAWDVAGAYTEDKKLPENISALVFADTRDSFQEISFLSDKAGGY